MARPVRRLYTASWVLTMDGPALEGGAVLVEGPVIRAVGRPAEVAPLAAGAERVDLPGCTLLPPLVNAHAHLELWGLVPPAGPGGFARWVLQVVARKRSAAPGRWGPAVAEAARACAQGGQGCVADVVTRPEAATAYPEQCLRILAYPELIVASPGRVEEAWAGVERLEEGCRPHLWGVSPHSPYTVCTEGLRRALARPRLMVHVAESPDEIEFCLTGRGPIRDELYAALGIDPPPPPGRHPVEWLHAIGALRPGTTLVHAVHLGAEHVALVARAGAGVVLCPRSNRRLSGRPAPGRELLEAGVPVGLGTDSVLSSGSLDLWADAAASVEDYGWTPQEALAAATRGGARVLGLGREAGCFAPGASADILAVRAWGSDPWEATLADRRAVGMWLGGEEGSWAGSGGSFGTYGTESGGTSSPGSS